MARRPIMYQMILHVSGQYLMAKLAISHSFLETVCSRSSLVSSKPSLLQKRLDIRPMTLTLSAGLQPSTKEDVHLCRGIRMIDDSRRSLYAPALEPLLDTVIRCVR
jgi:hypothetical protein